MTQKIRKDFLGFLTFEGTVEIRRRRTKELWVHCKKISSVEIETFNVKRSLLPLFLGHQ